jgi:hypothetical protein
MTRLVEEGIKKLRRVSWSKFVHELVPEFIDGS